MPAILREWTQYVPALVAGPDEVTQYQFDFSYYPEVSGGDLLNSVTSVTATVVGNVGAAALTVAGQTLSADKKSVLVTLGPGTAASAYEIKIIAVTAAGRTLEGIGKLSLEAL